MCIAGDPTTRGEGDVQIRDQVLYPAEYDHQGPDPYLHQITQNMSWRHMNGKNMRRLTRAHPLTIVVEWDT